MPAATDALANLTLTPHPQLSKRRKPTSAGRQCVAYGVGLQGGTAGVVQVVTILCKDANGQRRHTGGDVVTLSVTTPDDGAGGSCVGHVVDNGDGSYTASYLPRVASARCKIAAMVNGTHVQGSPFAAVVAPGRTDPSQTECFGRGLYDGTSGAQCAFTIATKDAYGNACHLPGDAFTVRVTPVQSLVPELATYLRDYPVAVELPSDQGGHRARRPGDDEDRDETRRDLRGRV